MLVFSGALLAQDLNIQNDQKETKTKKNRKIQIEFSPSVTLIPKLPTLENSYSAYTYDGNATSPIDSITSIYSISPWQNEKIDISSKLLYNLGISLKYKINKNLFIGFHPYYSFYNPKVKPLLYIDDQSNEVNRPEWDTTIYFQKPNFIGIPISMGMNLTEKISIEVGAQYLLSTSKLPSSIVGVSFITDSSFILENVERRFLPLSGIVAFNYLISSNLSFNFRCNYGISFYLPNTIAVNDARNYTFQNQSRQYYLYLNPSSKASVSNFSISAGINFSF